MTSLSLLLLPRLRRLSASVLFDSRRRAGCGGSGPNLRLIGSTKGATGARRTSFHQRTPVTEDGDHGLHPLTSRGCRMRRNGSCQDGVGIETRVRTLFGRQLGTLGTLLEMWRDQEGGTKLRTSEGVRCLKAKTSDCRLALKVGIRSHSLVTADVHGLPGRHHPPRFLHLFIRFGVYQFYGSCLLFYQSHHAPQDGLYT